MSNLKKEKSKVQTQQQFIYLLINVMEMYPQYSTAQHLAHIMRKKEEANQAYFWDEDLLLKKMEDYYDELNSELVKPTN